MEVFEISLISQLHFKVLDFYFVHKVCANILINVKNVDGNIEPFLTDKRLICH